MLAEIHVPISPTPGFFTRVRLLVATLRRYGGALRDAPVVVTVSRDCEPYDIAGALGWPDDDIEWRWIDRDRFAECGIYATALARFTYDFDADWVLQLDADVLCAAPLDELLLVPGEAIAGAVGHVSPEVHAPAFRDGVERRGRGFWDDLYVLAGLTEPALECEHTGWGITDHDPSRRFCPPYFNLGVLMARADVTRRLGEVIFDEMARVHRYVDTRFRCQLALTLAVERTRTQYLELPVRWNFPNHMGFWETWPDEAADLRLLHYGYAAPPEFDREVDTDSEANLARFAERSGLSPVHELLRDRVASVADALLAPAGA
jgi:hypothetical protein